MIRGFCTDKAFEKIVNLVEQKQFRQRWPCCMCGKDTERNDTEGAFYGDMFVVQDCPGDLNRICGFVY
nr:unnamed protein product [Callosobruchus analis]